MEKGNILEELEASSIAGVSKSHHIKFVFKKTFGIEKRRAEVANVLKKYPGRIPIIVERANRHIAKLDTSKYLLPADNTMGQFYCIIRRRLRLRPQDSLFFIVNGIIPQTTATMGQLYREYKDEDNFLYIAYSGENTYGSD